jgi:hypothetical protein
MAVWYADTATQSEVEAHDIPSRNSGLMAGRGSLTHVPPPSVVVRIWFRPAVTHSVVEGHEIPFWAGMPPVGVWTTQVAPPFVVAMMSPPSCGGLNVPPTATQVDTVGHDTLSRSWIPVGAS